MHCGYIRSVAVVAACVFPLTSCTSQGQHDDRDRDSLEEEVLCLKRELKDLREEMDTRYGSISERLDSKFHCMVEFHNIVQSMANDLQKREREASDRLLNLELKSYEGAGVCFNLKEHNEGYQALKYNLGYLTISVRDVQPHLNGYKVTLLVGNPTNVSFAHLKFKFCWGRKFSSLDSPGAFENWRKSMKEKEFSFTNDLWPGVQSPIEFYITPATLDELERVEIAVEVTHIRFLREVPY